MDKTIGLRLSLLPSRKKVRTWSRTSRKNYAHTKRKRLFKKKIPQSKKAFISPFNSAVLATAESLIADILKIFPSAQILFMGASALGIAGQNDIDLYLLAEPSEFEYYVPRIKSLFGEPADISKTFIEWNFTRNDFDVEFYITDPNTPSMQRQIKVFNTLKNNPELLAEYERIKLKFNGKSFRAYQKAKYEFYNKILG